MSITASSSPKPSNTVQPSTRVQNQVVTQRIIELRSKGMGFRRIAKQLSVEGLGTMSKSTVENRWKQTQASKNPGRKPSRNRVLNKLFAQQTNLQDQVACNQAVANARQSICDLQIQNSETPEGLQAIFMTKKSLTKFTLQALYDSKVLEAFKLRCREKHLPLAEAIAAVVGTLGDFVAQQEDSFGHFNLAGYVEEKLEDCLKREKQEQLEKRLWKFLLGFKCVVCGRPYWEFLIIDDQIVCPCHTRYTASCPECGNELNYDDHKDAFVCEKCELVFRRPPLKSSDFTFV